ncbi:hypothetical protein [Fructilactobacillus carniphilus]|uniref:Uncharacterized protein n=1 Tax=Fructilactobacillus carniphilus TaxID=2940297 RepID=A0ABY5BW09_9LACO|nr:hypothetical protein [Fructilactobacillus carniphilus]USS90143.1 hypothetical protein M3M37_04660 [Fructilactobacillus carniphilus]
MSYRLTASQILFPMPSDWMWDHRVVSVASARFNLNPLVNQMAYGYQSMAGLNQRIVDEFSACQYESIFNLNKYYDEMQ